MITLCFEPVGGAAGDMILAALFDLGASPQQVADTIRSGGLDDFTILFERRQDRNGIMAGWCEVEAQTPDSPRPETPHAGHGHDKDKDEHHDHDNDHDHGHGHGHGHGHEHGHDHGHEHEHGHGHGGAGHRGLRDILGIIECSAAAPRAKRRAMAIFRRLAEAEASVHGIAPEDVHFHEVGAVDAIVDIFGTCIALEELGVDEVRCSEFKIGRGTVRCAHGILPVPAPATVALLQGFPVRRLTIDAELTTPTGAAILTTLSVGDWSERACRMRRCGVGHGRRELDTVPNVIRAFLIEDGDDRQCVEIIETDVDDESPEVTATLPDRLRAAGALDATLTPLLMKKGRPGVRLTVIASVADSARLVDLIFRHSSTIGVRVVAARRLTLPRQAATVSTPWGEVAAKRIERPDRVELVPEFESCRALAESAQVSIREIMDAARTTGAAPTQTI